eukprot:m.156997 g.156997  ORF g.156997 m.156997 type:complete len:424 (+) comp31035_c3_seq1:96-1367(+)
MAMSFLARASTGCNWVQRVRQMSTASDQLKSIMAGEIQSIHEAGTYKHERVITTAQAASIGVQGRTEQVLNFCANNYLGLSNNAEVVAAGKHAMDTHGNGLGSVRFICGTQDIHKTLEKQISDFHDMEDSILFASCFDANAGIFETLLTPEDAIFSDELNHASIIDGIRLCKAQKSRYKHRDMADLEQKLQEKSGARMKMIVSDGVFSMDGTVAPLKEICDLADKYGALVFLDECHATGLFGATGRGTAEFCGVDGRVDIINSTMGKALGGAMGGYTSGSKEMIELLRQRARPYLFSNTLPPAVVGATSKVFDLISNDSTLVQKLSKNVARFTEGMTKAGFTVGGEESHPICPIHLGDARLASEFADEVLERGIFVIGFSFPVVPKGKARIRCQISADHSEDDIDHAVESFREIGIKKGIITA